MNPQTRSGTRFVAYGGVALTLIVGIVATSVLVNNLSRPVEESLYPKDSYAAELSELPPASARLGLYPGASAETRVDRFEAFETWLGRPLAAAGGNHGWHIEIRDDGSKKFEMNANSQGIFLNPPGRGGSWQRRPDVVLGLTVPLLPSTRGGLTDKMRTLGFDVEAPNGTKVHIDGFQDIAGGALDDQYRKLAENIKAAGAVNRTYIRLGHEAEINFYPWSMRDKEVGDAYGNMNERYKEAFRHVVGVFRSVDPGFMFDYQGDGSWAEIDPQSGVTYAQSGYPGDEYVNVIGVDIYDTRSWEENKRRLDETKRLAILHGKQLSVPEWGLVYKGCKKGEQDDGDPNRGGGDNPAFIQNMYEWLNALPASGPGSLAYHIYFSGPDVSCHNINRKEPNGSLAFPRANAKFKELFGPGNVVGVTPTPPITAAPTITITEPSPTATPSATPIVTVTTHPSCPRKESGDANCDGLVTLIDYEMWKQEYTEVLATRRADFDASNTVSMVDFAIWRQTYVAVDPTQTPAPSITTAPPTTIPTVEPTPIARRTNIEVTDAPALCGLSTYTERNGKNPTQKINIRAFSFWLFNA